MRRQLLTGLVMTVVMTVLVGFAYPLVVMGVGHLGWSSQADGSLVSRGDRVVGSSLIGQEFTDRSGEPLPQYFQPRPSAAGAGYDPSSSGASNLGPSNPKLADEVARRAGDYRRFNGLPAAAAVPVDAVTASGSGLDPDISPANSADQAPRVARARGLPLSEVLALVRANTITRPLGFLGEDSVNVLELNLALDRVR